MAKQFENSLSRLSRTETLAPLGVLTSVVFVFLLVGGWLSINLGSWFLSAIFGLLIVGIFVFAYLNFIQYRKLAAARGEGRISWESALPEVQRQNLNLEVLELSRILETGVEQLSDLQSAYIVAEDLALRQIQQEERQPLLRHVSVCGAPFNAVMIKNDVLVCAEVSFLVSPEVRKDKIDAMFRKIATVKSGLDQLKIEMRTELMMVLITQLNEDDETRLRADIRKRLVASAPVETEIRFLDFEALQRIYVTD